MMSFNFKLVILAVFLLFGSSVATRVNILKTLMEKENNDAKEIMARQALFKAWEKAIVSEQEIINRGRIIELANGFLTNTAQQEENNLKCLYAGAPCLVDSHCCNELKCYKSAGDFFGTCGV